MKHSERVSLLCRDGRGIQPAVFEGQECLSSKAWWRLRTTNEVCFYQHRNQLSYNGGIVLGYKKRGDRITVYFKPTDNLIGIESQGTWGREKAYLN